jgi:hypothetical protein
MNITVNLEYTASKAMQYLLPFLKKKFSKKFGSVSPSENTVQHWSN